MATCEVEANRFLRPDYKDSKKVREYYPKYLHVLVGADHEAGADGEEWSGRLQAITKQMDKNTAGTEDNMQKLVEELKQMSQCNQKLLQCCRNSTETTK